MVSEGYSVPEIDRQVRRFGMPMGPLELLDQVGLDVALHVAGSLDGVLPGVAPVVSKLALLVEQGHLGKKSSRGFYEYRKGKLHGPAPLSMIWVRSVPVLQDEDYADDSLSSIQRRLVYPMLAEAVRCHRRESSARHGPSTWPWCWERGLHPIAEDRCT